MGTVVHVCAPQLTVLEFCSYVVIAKTLRISRSFLFLRMCVFVSFPFSLPSISVIITISLCYNNKIICRNKQKRFLRSRWSSQSKHSLDSIFSHLVLIRAICKLLKFTECCKNFTLSFVQYQSSLISLRNYKRCNSLCLCKCWHVGLQRVSSLQQLTFRVVWTSSTVQWILMFPQVIHKW